MNATAIGCVALALCVLMFVAPAVLSIWVEADEVGVVAVGLFIIASVAGILGRTSLPGRVALYTLMVCLLVVIAVGARWAFMSDEPPNDGVEAIAPTAPVMPEDNGEVGDLRPGREAPVAVEGPEERNEHE